jgi:hypothetical protein
MAGPDLMFLDYSGHRCEVREWSRARSRGCPSIHSYCNYGTLRPGPCVLNGLIFWLSIQYSIFNSSTICGQCWQNFARVPSYCVGGIPLRPPPPLFVHDDHPGVDFCVGLGFRRRRRIGIKKLAGLTEVVAGFYRFSVGTLSRLTD